jgi:hypothetical protein
MPTRKISSIIFQYDLILLSTICLIDYPYFQAMQQILKDIVNPYFLDNCLQHGLEFFILIPFPFFNAETNE